MNKLRVLTAAAFFYFIFFVFFSLGRTNKENWKNILLLNFFIFFIFLFFHFVLFKSCFVYKGGYRVWMGRGRWQCMFELDENCWMGWFLDLRRWRLKRNELLWYQIDARSYGTIIEEEKRGEKNRKKGEERKIEGKKNYVISYIKVCLNLVA